ncbi:MAG: hypothetical protein U0441_14365 [Polyangiaceae bacterium]
MRVAFVPRRLPLSPRAAAGVGPVARSLAERLLSMEDRRLGELRGVTGTDVLVVLGEAESLPWVDEIVYLGVDASAPRLLLPTALGPDVPAALFENALFSRLPKERGPLAVLPAPRRIVPVSTALHVDRRSLERWLSR